jgi:hypothetical protein
MSSAAPYTQNDLSLFLVRALFEGSVMGGYIPINLVLISGNAIDASKNVGYFLCLKQL